MEALIKLEQCTKVHPLFEFLKQKADIGYYCFLIFSSAIISIAIVKGN